MVATLRRAIALLLIVMALGVTSCGGDRDVPVVLLAADETTPADHNPLTGELSEVSPPGRIQQLKPYLDVYAPQVRIASPDPDATLTKTTVTVRLQIRDFPIYKDQSLGFGPHLHLFLDDQPHQAIYDADAPITLEDLAPGTHTLRLLAVRPWGESFKNEGAYAQVTFNVFAASPQNKPDDSQPLLTYSQPQERYGAEPILLDFYLSNAPLHLVARADETINDWRIRCTVNGESFVFDRWQPIYLQGFKPGKNWVKLELIDDYGNLIDNAFNTSIRVLDYQPGGEDSLSALIRGEISLAQAKGLVDPNYEPPILNLEAPIETPSPGPALAPEKVTDEVSSSEDAAAPDTQLENTDLPFSASDSNSIIEPAPTDFSGERNQIDTSTPQTGNDTLDPVEANLDEDTTSSQPDAATDTAPGETVESEAIDSDRSQPISDTSQPSTMGESVEDGVIIESLEAAKNTSVPEMPAETTTEDDLEEAILENENGRHTEQEEGLSSADEVVPGLFPGEQNPIDDDDLTENSRLEESQDPDFPKSTSAAESVLALEEEKTAASDIDTLNEPNDLETPSQAQSSQTNLKTLEDNADLI